MGKVENFVVRKNCCSQNEYITKVDFFLFQMLPIYIDEKICKRWPRMINNVVWSGKKPGISFKVLQDKKKREEV